MVDACENEQSRLLKQYVLTRKDELSKYENAEDSAAGPNSIAPYVPCASSRIPYILQAARIGPDDVLWDLGCGDGIVLLAAAERYGCRVVGLDIDAPCVEMCRSRSQSMGLADRCQWLRCDMLKLPFNTLAGSSAAPRISEEQSLSDKELLSELDKLWPATAALVFLTGHGLVRIAPWLHEEWKQGPSRGLRLVTCVESLDTAVDFQDEGALFADANVLNWPVCRDHDIWGVFVVPPFGKDISEWSRSGCPPLQPSIAEAEATRPAIVQKLLDESQVAEMDVIGRSHLCSEDEAAGGYADEPSLFDLPVDEDGSFHAAAEAALHKTVLEHRVVYLHSETVRKKFSKEQVEFLDRLEKHLIEVMEREDSGRWGLLRSRSYQVRSFEYHAYCDGGSVYDPEHRDQGSLLTVSVLLSPLDDFKGGVFSTFSGSDRIEHMLDRGDGIVFVSEKRHNVSTVAGDRRVIVMELWDGPRNKQNRHA
eukprot:TRINITY_DN48884_c0_g1_i1.p1 TRINITY_DN48884_c0_g1~~TRINITY_DN48884_c0_g1_i1.p1  ORF type:complete len:479 (+),score=97.87 TRINITY_DN48884_c0_g1_i1:59-1495(+)